MKPIICLIQSLKPEQVTYLAEQYPNYSIVPVAELTTEMEANVEITLGWQKELGERLLANSRLKWIQAISAGVDSFDQAALAEKGILLSNGSGIHTTAITEHVLGVTLAIFRGLPQAVLQQAQHEWQNQSLPFVQLSGKNMLVIGTGHIGQQVGKNFQALGVHTYGVNTTGHSVPGFEETYASQNLLKFVADMDIIVNILPLTDETYHLYNQVFFEAMSPTGIFINVGRGPSVHTADLVTALNQHELAYAALDVFEEEPLPIDHPLWTMENVLITPHHAGVTEHFRDRIFAIFRDNLAQYQVDGTLKRNQIQLDRGY